MAYNDKPQDWRQQHGDIISSPGNIGRVALGVRVLVLHKLTATYKHAVTK